MTEFPWYTTSVFLILISCGLVLLVMITHITELVLIHRKFMKRVDEILKRNIGPNEEARHDD